MDRGQELRFHYSGPMLFIYRDYRCACEHPRPLTRQQSVNATKKYSEFMKEAGGGAELFADVTQRNEFETTSAIWRLCYTQSSVTRGLGVG